MNGTETLGLEDTTDDSHPSEHQQLACQGTVVQFPSVPSPGPTLVHGDWNFTFCPWHCPRKAMSQSWPGPLNLLPVLLTSPVTAYPWTLSCPQYPGLGPFSCLGHLLLALVVLHWGVLGGGCSKPGVSQWISWHSCCGLWFSNYMALAYFLSEPWLFSSAKWKIIINLLQICCKGERWQCMCGTYANKLSFSFLQHYSALI